MSNTGPEYEPTHAACGIEESATTLFEKFVATFLIMAPSPLPAPGHNYVT
jgi:hypothetical protein